MIILIAGLCLAFGFLAGMETYYYVYVYDRDAEETWNKYFKKIKKQDKENLKKILEVV